MNDSYSLLIVMISEEPILPKIGSLDREKNTDHQNKNTEIAFLFSNQGRNGTESSS